MLRERAETVGALFYLLDLTALALAGGAAHAIRAQLDPAFPDLTDYLPLYGVMVAIWSVLLYHFGVYDRPRGARISADLTGLLKTSLLGFLLAGALVFGLKLHFVSRLLVGTFSVVAFLFLAVERMVARIALGHMAAAERNILLVARDGDAGELRR